MYQEVFIKENRNHYRSSEWRAFSFGNHMACWCNGEIKHGGETTQKLACKEAVDILDASTMQGSGVIRIQELQPSLGAKLRTRLPRGNWEHKRVRLASWRREISWLLSSSRR